MENLQTLITEKAKDVQVELSSLFEGLDLSDELKENLQVTFDTAVQTSATQIASAVLEEQIKEIEDNYTSEIFEIVESLEKTHQEKLDALTESTQIYIDDFLAEWKEENKIAIDNQLKAKLFDQIFEQLSNVFVEHNLNVPTEEINVYEELQQECDELQEKVDSLLKENQTLKVSIQESQVKETIKKLIQHLTESQIEKVIALSENIQIDQNVEKKLKTIVAMVEATSSKEDEEKDKTTEDPEKKSDKKDEEKDKKIDESSVPNLNYVDTTNNAGNAAKPSVIDQYILFQRQ